MRKKYIAPTLEIVDLPSESRLLADSLGIHEDGAIEGDVRSAKRPKSWSENIWGESNFGALNSK